MDPLSLLRYLGSLGTIDRIAVDDSALPEASDMDPETSYLTFDAELSTEAPKSEIESVFDFVREDSDIRIVPRDHDEFVGRIESMPDRDRLGDVLQESGAVTPGRSSASSQTVIKPLGPLFSSLKCVSGSTILGNGDVALMLDVGPLVTEYADLERTRYAGSGNGNRRPAATRS